MSFILEPDIFGSGTDLIVTGRWSPEALRALEERRADRLVLNYARGFSEETINFITDLPIRRLLLLAPSLRDVSPLYSLKDDLHELQITVSSDVTLELERLPELHVLRATWDQIHNSVRYLPKLEDLLVSDYSGADLRILAPLTGLSSLIFKHAPGLRSLSGIEDLPWLTRFRVGLARRLDDIEALRGPSPVLQELRFEDCKHIRDMTPMASLRMLNWFELSEGATIPTVAPLANLELLERLYLYGTTLVADGNLDPIAALPRLRELKMANRRHYKPSVSHIQRLISSRHRS